MFPYSTTVMASERHYLKLILLNVAGATSFEHLRTVNGVVHPTFLETAKALHLIEDDNEWRRCMQQSATTDMPHAMRSLFATILLYGPPRDPQTLFQEFIPVRYPMPLIITVLMHRPSPKTICGRRDSPISWPPAPRR